MPRRKKIKKTNVDTTLLIIDESKKTDDIKFVDLYMNLMEEVNSLQKQMRSVKNNMNKLYSAYKHDIKHALKNNSNKKTKKKKTGFQILRDIPNDIADFIGVEHGTKMSRTKLSSEIQSTLKERKLYYEKDKRIYRADKEVLKLFNLSKDVNKITDAKDKKALTIFTIQKYLKDKINKENINEDNNEEHGLDLELEDLEEDDSEQDNDKLTLNLKNFKGNKCANRKLL